jgi:malate/lactate dehydrogenase
MQEQSGSGPQTAAEVLPVNAAATAPAAPAYSEKYGLTLSLLRRVGRSGVPDEFEIEVNKEEQIGIERSVEALKAAMNRLDRANQPAILRK